MDEDYEAALRRLDPAEFRKQYEGDFSGYRVSNDTTLVIAGTHREYTDFLRLRNLNPREYVYVSRMEQLEGRDGAQCVVIGRYGQNDAWRSGYFRDVFQHRNTVTYL